MFLFDFFFVATFLSVRPQEFDRALRAREKLGPPKKKEEAVCDLAAGGKEVEAKLGARGSLAISSRA